MPDEENTG